ncbi:hypothetical protein OUZ56_003781 [Daphnia magna]|uniref:CHK kinase-like domain-containing protein n=1 Tax=Daphnia magna TaxID=35525 RepID=A0ABQ9YMX2_9CRUS|nr:hypothetical protein OUZ56_003781 [Daphnia magna]
MTGTTKQLAERQSFWRTLFEAKTLAGQLVSLARDHTDGVTYDDLPHYGRVRVVVKPASSLGDNFMSDTFIVTAQISGWEAIAGDGDTLSTFVKVLPSNFLLRQAAYESRVHQREIKMYDPFFVLLREMYADQPIPLNVPHCYYTHVEEVVNGETDASAICILLQDLKAENYRMADKTRGADYRHCHMALTSLAHYHALTLNALRQWKDPSTCQLSNCPPNAKFLLEEKTTYDFGLVQHIQNSSKRMLEFIQEANRPDLVEWFTELLQRLHDVILIDTFESSGPLACVLHGDYWINNMLFKYEDEGEVNSSAPAIPVALKMIDFQISRIGHPISDILYFMYSSVAPETREKHMLVLLRYYFDTLTTDLRLLGVSLDDYNWQDFLDDYKKRSQMWMLMGIVVLSAALNKTAVNDLQELDAEEKLKGPKPSGTDAEPVKGETGFSLELEETMKNMMATRKLSDNPILTDRLVKLISEVKDLNCSVPSYQQC